jgi:peptide/nickel transport system permease protein
MSFKRQIDRLKGFWEDYKGNRSAVIGLIIVLFFALVGFFGLLIPQGAPWKTGDYVFSSPSAQNLMGTDDLGRDLFMGVVYGTRISLLVGSLAAATSVIIGILVGGFSGYFGGTIDDLLMRVAEFFQVIPRFFLLLVLVALFGPSVWNIIFAIGVLSWPGTARLVRAEFLSLKERPFVEAARALRVSDTRIILEEILPNASPPIIVNAIFEIGHAIAAEAGLSFLGLGDPNIMSWGYLLYNANHYLRSAWWLAFFPGLALCLLVLGLNLFCDGLNDALNPKKRGV